MTTNTDSLLPEVIDPNPFPAPNVATDVSGTTLDTVNKRFKDTFGVGGDRVKIDAIHGRIIIFDTAGVARIVIGFLANAF